MDEAQPTKPVLAGIIPIKSVKMATYMNEKIPGIDIPSRLIKQIEAAGDNETKIEEVSIGIAAQTIRSLRPFTRGVHIMAIGWENRIPAILAQCS